MATRSSTLQRTRSRKPPGTVIRPPPALGQNRLLATLPPIDRERILQTLSVVPLVLRELLHKPGDPIGYVYFPGGGFLSIVTVLENGRMVEVATIGREGMAGLAAAIDGLAVASATMVQGESDTCYRMPAEAFRAEMDRRGPFYTLLTSYSHAMAAACMQSAACNAVHSVEQRLARWLLTAQDRMERDEFLLTQEFAAMMLGTSRQRVTIVAGMLQEAGLISYRRGALHILNRRDLESASCECHRATAELFDAVFTSAHTRP